MSTLTQTQAETQNLEGSAVLNVQTTTFNQSKNKFVRPPMPTFNSPEEKQKHVKERLACALRPVSR